EEIGMGDDLNLPERKSVRTAMQWSDQRNGGFSTVAPRALKYPLIRAGEFSYPNTNVKTQEANPKSLLNEIMDMIRDRKKACAQFSYGQFTLLTNISDMVLAYCYDDGKQLMIFVHNFSAKTVTTSIGIPLREGAVIRSLL